MSDMHRHPCDREVTDKEGNFNEPDWVTVKGWAEMGDDVALAVLWVMQQLDRKAPK